MVHRVLVAVDGTPASHAALEVACALADNYEAALGLLTVMEPDEVTNDVISAAETEGMLRGTTTYGELYNTGYAGYPARLEDMVRAERAQRVAMIMADAVTKEEAAFSRDKPFKAVKTFVTTGEPASTIVRVAEENRADLIIMGHDQQGRVEAIFRSSVAEKVQRDAKCPVLIYCLPKDD